MEGIAIFNMAIPSITGTQIICCRCMNSLGDGEIEVTERHIGRSPDNLKRRSVGEAIGVEVSIERKHTPVS